MCKVYFGDSYCARTVQQIKDRFLIQLKCHTYINLPNTLKSISRLSSLFTYLAICFWVNYIQF